jgi:hypothetical protein
MICHSLYPPKDGRWLSPAEVASRLRSHIPAIEVSSEEGIAHAHKILLRLKQLCAPARLIEQLEQTYEDSLAIYVPDGSEYGTKISLIVLPKDAIKIYHESYQMPAIEKCRAALGYDIIEL